MNSTRDCDRNVAGVKKRVSAACVRLSSTMSKSGAVLWLHGLGDTGAGWEGAFGALAKKFKFHHPDAPVQEVSIEAGAKMTSWFDIVVWPLGLSEPEGPTGIDASVARVHAMLDDIEKSGTPTDRIVLGGFSQGGTLSLLAGLTYPKKLAGVASISGWCAYRADLPAKVHAANKELPVHFSVGTGDPIVTYPLGKASGELLQAILGDNLSNNAVNRGMHQPDRSEMQAVSQFIEACLP